MTIEEALKQLKPWAMFCPEAWDTVLKYMDDQKRIIRQQSEAISELNEKYNDVLAYIDGEHS